jgi:hypothetical protein
MIASSSSNPRSSIFASASSSSLLFLSWCLFPVSLSLYIAVFFFFLRVRKEEEEEEEEVNEGAMGINGH